MKLAHIGFLFKDINQGINYWSKNKFDFEQKFMNKINKRIILNKSHKNNNSPVKIIIKPTVDKKLKVTCCLIKIKKDFLIEIIQPHKNNVILKKKIENRNYTFGSIDHLCFFSNNIDKDIKFMTNNLNARLVVKKTYAKLFKKNICFLVVKSLLIELLEV